MCDSPSLSLLQTLKGDLAKGVTQEEYEEVFQRCHDELKRLQKLRPVNFPGGVHVVMDNARWHASTIRQLGEHSIGIPPLSPEFNKPVEHAINAIKEAYDELYHNLLMEAGPGRCIPFSTAQGILERVMNEKVKASSVLKDVKTLKKTFQAVIDAEGGRIPSKLS